MKQYLQKLAEWFGAPVYQDINKASDIIDVEMIKSAAALLDRLPVSMEERFFFDPRTGKFEPLDRS